MAVKTLIVEDENWVRKGIKKMIRWKELDMELIGEMENGEEALRMFEQNTKKSTPDLVITDMLMPKMDGMHLLKCLENLSIDCEFIVLSGYSDFKYMKQAIRSGVCEYLLKPVDGEELNQVLEKVLYKINVKRKEHEDHRQRSAEQMVYRLAHGEPFNEALLPQSMQELLNSRCFSMMSILIKQRNSLDAAIPLLDEIYRLFTESRRAAGFAETKGEWYWLLGDDKPADGRMSLIQREWVEKIMQLGKIHNVNVRIGVSSWKHGQEEIRHTYEEAKHLLRYQHNGMRDIISPDEIAEPSEKEKQPIVSEQQLEIMMDNSLYEELAGFIEKYFQELQRQRIVNLRDVRKTIVEWIFDVERCCQRMDKLFDIYKVLGVDCIEHIESLQTLDFLQDWVLMAHESIVRECINQPAEKGDIIQEIKSYIEGNYYEEIQLITLAQKHYMNHIYLSRLFKQKTGENFIDYLTRIRMTRAKELLGSGRLKIKEVSQLVGYQNPYYFSKSYKKYFSEKTES